MARLFAVTAGLIAWAVQFTVIYGVTAVACARGYAGVTLLGLGVVPLTIVATTVLAFAATGVVLAWGLRERRRADADTHPTDRFLTSATLLVSGLSLVTIAWHGLPALLVPVCT
jgi:hypothetical protein